MTVQKVAEIAKAITLNHGYHGPMILVEGTVKGTAISCQDFPADSFAKQEYLFRVGATVGKAGTVGELRQVFFISEAWRSPARGGKIPAVPPSKDPSRQEILIITSLAVAPRETDLVLFAFIRDPRGHLLDLKEAPSLSEKGSTEHLLLDAFMRGFS